MASTTYADQITAKYKCGDYHILVTGNPEQEALTNLVIFKLQRAKLEQATKFANHVSQPTLQQYLDRLACNGQDNLLSNAEALYIEGQIELMYME